MRSGAQYLGSLKDARRVYVDGAAVPDVVAHPAFRGVTATVASLYDYALDSANGMTFTEPTSGVRANKVFMIPRSRDELRARREAIDRWARLTNGLLGRSPDHVAGFIAGFAAAPDVFAHGRDAFGDHVLRFYRKIVEEDLYVAYVIIPP